MKHKRFMASQRGEIDLLIIALGVLVVFVIAFAVIAILNYSSARKATTTLNQAKATAYQQGKKVGADEQDKKDYQEAQVAAATPYRSYDAPDAFGNFTVKFPKNWSSWVNEAETSTLQVNFIANPDIIKVRANAKDNYALHVQLNRINYETTKQVMDQQVKSKKATAKAVKVMGIDGTRYDGQYDNDHNGIKIILPVRDKTISFSCENTKYTGDFDQILAQSTIVP